MLKYIMQNNIKVELVIANECYKDYFISDLNITNYNIDFNFINNNINVNDENNENESNTFIENIENEEDEKYHIKEIKKIEKKINKLFYSNMLKEVNKSTIDVINENNEFNYYLLYYNLNSYNRNQELLILSIILFLLRTNNLYNLIEKDSVIRYINNGILKQGK